MTTEHDGEKPAPGIETAFADLVRQESVTNLFLQQKQAEMTVASGELKQAEKRVAAIQDEISSNDTRRMEANEAFLSRLGEHSPLALGVFQIEHGLAGTNFESQSPTQRTDWIKRTFGRYQTFAAIEAKFEVATEPVLVGRFMFRQDELAEGGNGGRYRKFPVTTLTVNLGFANPESGLEVTTNTSVDKGGLAVADVATSIDLVLQHCLRASSNVNGWSYAGGEDRWLDKPSVASFDDLRFQLFPRTEILPRNPLEIVDTLPHESLRSSGKEYLVIGSEGVTTSVRVLREAHGSVNLDTSPLDACQQFLAEACNEDRVG